MNGSEAPGFTELPVAYTLDAADGPQRLARWRAASARGAPSVRREADALVVAYPDGPGVREELEALVAAERRCCAFAEWAVEPLPGTVVVRISAQPDGLDAIAALFGAG